MKYQAITGCEEFVEEIAYDLDKKVVSYTLALVKTKRAEADLAVAIGVAALQRSLIRCILAQATGLGDHWDDERIGDVRKRFENLIEQLGRETADRINSKLN